MFDGHEEDGKEKGEWWVRSIDNKAPPLVLKLVSILFKLSKLRGKKGNRSHISNSRKLIY